MFRPSFLLTGIGLALGELGANSGPLLDHHDDGLSLLQLRSAYKSEVHSIAESEVLLQASQGAPEQIDENKRCRQKELQRSTFGSVQECVDYGLTAAGATTVAYWSQSNEKPRHRGICMAYGGECKRMGTQLNTVLYDLYPVEAPEVLDEAAAVGDPHLTAASGQAADLCCDGGKCHPCSAELLEFGQGAPEQIDENKRCRQKELQRSTFGSVQECVDYGLTAAGATTVAYWSQKQRHRGAPRGICMAYGGECKRIGTQLNTVLYDLYPVEAPEVLDEASAVGDPHLTSASGQASDLCCDGGKCHPCSAELLEFGQGAPEQIDENKRCRQKELQRSTFGSVQECVDYGLTAAGATTVAYWSQSNEKPRHRGICMAYGGECKRMGTQLNTVLYDLYPVEAPEVLDEAAAVGDPHLTSAAGQNSELCCEGGLCGPCVQ